jgi:hypothetical protein
MGKQSRRTISLCRSTYERLREYATKHERSMSDIVEELLRPVLGAAMTLTPPMSIPASREKPHREQKRRPNWGRAVVKPRQPVREISAGTNDPARSRPSPTRVPMSKEARPGEGVRW